MLTVSSMRVLSPVFRGSRSVPRVGTFVPCIKLVSQASSLGDQACVVAIQPSTRLSQGSSLAFQASSLAFQVLTLLSQASTLAFRASSLAFRASSLLSQASAHAI
jgi:hypothetical protein